jgi:hypothetical protein
MKSYNNKKSKRETSKKRSAEGINYNLVVIYFNHHYIR